MASTMLQLKEKLYIFIKSCSLRHLFISMMLLSFAAPITLKLPIYTDEVSYKILQARYFSEGKAAHGLMPSCKDPNQQHQWPLLSLPSRIGDSLIYGKTVKPIIIRIAGWVNFFVWLILMSMAFRGFGVSLLFFSAVTSLGVLPFLMVLNRPEQKILLGVAACLALRRNNVLGRFKKLKPMLFAVIALFFFYEHPKALVFVPFFLSCLFLGSTSNLKIKLSASVFIVFIAASAFQFYANLNNCPQDANIAAELKKVALQPGDIFVDHKDFFSQGFRNFQIKPYSNNVSFERNYMSQWLPSINPRPHFLASWLNTSFYLAFIFIALFAVFGWCFFWLFARFNKSSRDIHFRRERFIFLSLNFAICSMMFSETAKNAYLSSLILPLWSVVFWFFLELIESYSRYFCLVRRVALWLTSLLAITSLIVLKDNFIYFSKNQWLGGGAIVQQFYSFSPYAFEDQASTINEAASKCGLDRKLGHQHLLLDDLTYSVFSESFQPFHSVYVTGVMGKGIPDLLSFLRDRGSHGVIAQCKFFTDANSRHLRETMLETRGFCCSKL